MEKIRCVHLVVSGRVQGVGYRAFTARRASALQLNGWVRNLTNGNVEAVISGPEQIVDELLAALHDGPLAARVDHIEIREHTEIIQQGFKRLETA